MLSIFLLINYCNNEHLKNLYFPFLKDFSIYLGIFFIPFSLFIIVGSSNAVNLTDGLDGLATVPVMLVAISFTLICYVVGNTLFSEYLKIPYIPNVGEASIFCGSIVGSCLGFLWFNAPPGKNFYGDTGSLSLGGSLGAVSIISKHEIVLGIIGGLFVLETASVIIQVISFKLTGKRVFMMAPLHHHFEKKGWAESTIVIRFWIISIILALIGFSHFKIKIDMLNKQEYQNKNIVIYGMGLTGLSTGQTLKKLKANITCWDDNKKTRSKIKKFKLQKFWLGNKKIDFIVVSPGIDIKKCKVKNFLKKKYT